MQCEEICVPHPSTPECKHCETVCPKTPEDKNICAQPKKLVWTSWIPGCGADVFTSTYVPTANSSADRAGGVFGRGAIVWADGTIVNDDPTGQSMVIGGKILFERARTAKSGLTAYVSHRYLGAAEGVDLCGVSIITDA